MLMIMIMMMIIIIITLINLYHILATIIRYIISRIWIRIWKWAVYRLTRVILPKIKRFIKNSFLSWSYRRQKYAIKIQTVIRKFIAVNHYYRKFGYRYYYLNVFPQASVMIQKLVRGFLGMMMMMMMIIMIMMNGDSDDDNDIMM